MVIRWRDECAVQRAARDGGEVPLHGFALLAFFFVKGVAMTVHQVLNQRAFFKSQILADLALIELEGGIFRHLELNEVTLRFFEEHSGDAEERISARGGADLVDDRFQRIGLRLEINFDGQWRGGRPGRLRFAKRFPLAILGWWAAPFRSSFRTPFAAWFMAFRSPSWGAGAACSPFGKRLRRGGMARPIRQKFEIDGRGVHGEVMIENVRRRQINQKAKRRVAFDGRRCFCSFVGMGSSAYPLQGKLILDSGKLAGSYFDRTVILVCRQDESGSFGLILNRPLGKTLKAVTDFPMGKVLSHTAIYMGGPVQTEMFSVLFECEEESENDVVTSLQLGHSLQEISDRFESDQPPLRVRAYAGYAGWSSGQLEEEMKQGCWITHSAALADVFSPEPMGLWPQTLKKKGGIYQLVSQFPADPSQN